jgi:hypothetical protein
MRHILLFVAGAWMLSIVSMESQNAKDEGWSQLLPPGEGRELVITSCTTCHNAKVVVHARKLRDDWTKSVGDMIQRGAPIFPEEIDPITTYLAKAFGQNVPKLVNVNSAARTDLEALPGLNAEMVARILDARSKAGAIKNPEELRTALAMTKEEFEKIRYLLKYSN